MKTTWFLKNWLDLSVVFDKLWVKFDMGSYCFGH